MRYLKLFLISVLVFGGLFFLIGLLFPSRIRISRAINIGIADTVARQRILDTAQWVDWHPAFAGANGQAQPPPERLSRAEKIRFLERSDTLIRAEAGESGGRGVENGWAFHRTASPDSVTVQWYMDFRLGIAPWQRFGALLLEDTYGPMMERGLEALRRPQP